MAPMPDKFGGAPTKWALFKTQFEAYMNSLSEEYHSILSHSRYRYDYDEPTGPRADGAMANDIVPLFRHPNNVQGRNKTVYNTLKSLMGDGDAYTHVLAHESTQDGRPRGSPCAPSTRGQHSCRSRQRRRASRWRLQDTLVATGV